MMKNESRFEIESRAYGGLQQLMAKAREVRLDFESAGLELPAPLARIFDEMSLNSGANEGATKLKIPPLQSPSRPTEATASWIWINIEDILIQTLVLGILRKNGDSMRPKDILKQAVKMNANTNGTSVYNVGPRLDGGLLDRKDGLWRLTDDSKAPVLFEGNAWGDPGIFQKQELAAHRRSIILHILGLFTDGMLQMQIVKQLQTCQFCKAPVSKDLVKIDIIQLAKESKIKRIGRSKKWTVADKIQTA